MYFSQVMTQRLAECPSEGQPQLKALLNLIYDCAKEEQLDLSCGLKWHEPSFWTKKGSPFRIHWDESGNLSLMFLCQTKLIETFRTVFPDWTYEGNRALHLDGIVLEQLPPILHCAFHYQSLRHKPLLGLLPESEE